MMNRFQFRAWDKEVKKLYPYITVYAQDFGHVQVNENGEDKLIYPENLVLMQATGLKDIHSKDIFESDIVRYISKQPNGKPNITNRLRVVEYKAGLNGTGFNLGIGRKREGCSYEIVGNIYENKDIKLKK